MPVTNPENLAYPGRNGDTEETAVTNAAASGPGFPAKTQGGDLVFIVKQRREHQLKVLVDADGNEYVDDGVLGFLVPYSSEELPETLDDLPVVRGESIDGVEEVQDGIDAVYHPDAIDALTADAVAEAVEETVGDEAIELTQPKDLAESA